MGPGLELTLDTSFRSLSKAGERARERGASAECRLSARSSRRGHREQWHPTGPLLAAGGSS